MLSSSTLSRLRMLAEGKRYSPEGSTRRLSFQEALHPDLAAAEDPSTPPAVLYRLLSHSVTVKPGASYPSGVVGGQTRIRRTFTSTIDNLPVVLRVASNPNLDKQGVNLLYLAAKNAPPGHRHQVLSALRDNPAWDMFVLEDPSMARWQLEARLRALAEGKSPTTPGPKWHAPHPDSDDLGGDDGEIAGLADREGLDRAKIHHAVKKAHEKGELHDLDDATWKTLQNTDSWDTDTLPKAEKLARHYGRNIDSLVKGHREGHKMPAAVIVKTRTGHHLVGGNTRLMVSRALGHRPKVVIADLTK